MIQYVKRKDLDISKYDSCIENSIQSKIYGFSWYLDIVADNWDALVLDDYKAVMPIPWRKKFGVKYAYPPFWILQLGIFSTDKKIKEDNFLKLLFKNFRFVEVKMNSGNKIANFKRFTNEKEFQFLSINKDYELIQKEYQKDRKKDIRKANELDLEVKWNNTTKELISLFKNNVGKRVSKITEKDYAVLAALIKQCLEREVGEQLSVYHHENLVASAFILKYKSEITILVSSTDFENRKNGANTFLIYLAIQKYHQEFQIFNFGGSSIKSVAKYFKSFGAETEKYQQIKYNNLPKLISFFKQ